MTRRVVPTGTSVTIRPGTTADVPAVLAMLDGAIRWLSERGRTGQWGSEPQSAEPRRIESLTTFAEDGGLWLAEIDGEPVGALAVGAAPSYAQPITEPELYVNWLLTDRTREGQGIGGRLLAHARELAASAGVALLRVDCYAGDDRALVGYYESQGFTATRQFAVAGWPGQILEQRLS
jgi:GNAT superfamily N-acetyltransferase